MGYEKSSMYILRYSFIFVFILISTLGLFAGKASAQVVIPKIYTVPIDSGSSATVYIDCGSYLGWQMSYYLDTTPPSFNGASFFNGGAQSIILNAHSPWVTCWGGAVDLGVLSDGAHTVNFVFFSSTGGDGMGSASFKLFGYIPASFYVGPSVITSFTANPSNTTVGGTSILSWVVASPNVSCELTGYGYPLIYSTAIHDYVIGSYLGDNVPLGTTGRTRQGYFYVDGNQSYTTPPLPSSKIYHLWCFVVNARGWIITQTERRASLIVMVCASNVGSSCSSVAANSCGDSNFGFIQCDGSCSVNTTAPAERPYWHNTCTLTSAPNACGKTATASGLTDCSGIICTGTTPAPPSNNTCIPSVPTISGPWKSGAYLGPSAPAYEPNGYQIYANSTSPAGSQLKYQFEWSKDGVNWTGDPNPPASEWSSLP